THAENPGIVRGRLFEASGIRFEREVILEVLLVADHAVGADRYRAQSLQHARSDVRETHPDGTQQPFLGAGAEEVDGRGSQVQPQGAGRLDRIYHQQDIAALELSAQRGEIG